MWFLDFDEQLRRFEEREVEKSSYPGYEERLCKIKNATREMLRETFDKEAVPPETSVPGKVYYSCNCASTWHSLTDEEQKKILDREKKDREIMSSLGYRQIRTAVDGGSSWVWVK